MQMPLRIAGSQKEKTISESKFLQLFDNCVTSCVCFFIRTLL